MKTIIKPMLTAVFVLLVFTTINAQNIQASLDAAQSSYAANQSLEARENLQQALIDLNNLIGKEILDLMPSSVGDLPINTPEDNIVGGTGFAGLLVNRMYGTQESKHVDITLANESPMLAVVNTFLSNSMLSGLMGSQTGQKKVTIAGYKGMMERNEGDGDYPTVYTVNVPIGDSLFTLESTGFDNDGDVISMAQQMNIDKIASMLK